MKVFLCILGMFISFQLNGQEKRTLIPLRTESGKIDRFVSAFTGVHLFSGVVLVSLGDSILFHKSYGMADYEWNVPNTLSSRFRIASLSKAFTATMILQMAEQGMIDLQATVSEYLPEYTGIFRDSITIHQLLSHSSGIPHYESVPDFDPVYTRVPLSSAEYICLISGLKPVSSPGTKYYYSSFGYYLLGAILEKVSGMSYPDLLRKNILQPAGMKNTSFDEMIPLRQNMTSGYNFDHTGIINCRFEDTYKSKGCGGMISTAEDMFRWSRALAKGLLLSESSSAKMFTRKCGKYGYGWIIQEIEGTTLEKSTVSMHGGSDFGFASYIYRNIDEDICIVVLSNLETAPVWRITEGIWRIISGKEVNPPNVRPIAQIGNNPLVEFSGKYQVSPDYSIDIYAEEKGLLIKWTGMKQRLLLFPSSDSTFFIRENDKLFTFNRDRSRKITSLSFDDKEGIITARKEINSIQ